MKTLYYTVEKETINSKNIAELRNITIYKMIKNKPIVVGELQSKSDDTGLYFKNVSEEILDYIDEFLPEYDSNKLDFIQL